MKCDASTAVLTGPSESPPKWSVYVMVSPALMAPTLVTASAMMAELGPVPLGPRLAVECAEHAIIFVSCTSCGCNQPVVTATAAFPKTDGSEKSRRRSADHPLPSPRRSLQGPWHGPSGTQPSPAIESASPTIALATSAPIYLHLCNRTGARRPRCARK